MARTVTEQRSLPGKQTRNQKLIERDIHAYKRHMAGLSVRAIGEELGLKSTQTVWGSIQRGKEYAKAQGIDAEETRIKIQQLFEETLGYLAATAKAQHLEGSVTEFIDAEGNTSIKRVRGVDPRIAGELSRSLNRWAEFVGLLERAPEQNVQATSIVLTAPAAGADFESRYANMPAANAEPLALDAAATPVKSEVISEGGPGWGAPPADAT